MNIRNGMLDTTSQFFTTGKQSASCTWGHKSLREGFRAILGEHRDDHIDDDVQFGLICRCHVDEYVLSVERNFGVI